MDTQLNPNAYNGQPQRPAPLDGDSIRTQCRCADSTCECHTANGHVHCPAHNDTHPSLSVDERNGKTLFVCRSGCTQEAVLSALKSKTAPTRANGSEPRQIAANRAKTTSAPAFDWNTATIYEYHDEVGELVSQVARQGNGKAKQIRQRRPHPERAGVWIYGLTAGFYECKKGHFYKCGEKTAPPAHAVEFPEAKRVLYRRDEVARARFVIACEGEKAVEVLRAALEEEGLSGEYTATCNVMGAGKGYDQWAHECAGKTVYVAPDNDKPGRKHASQIVAHVAPVSLEVRVMELPDQDENDGPDDFLKRGNSIFRLLEIAEAAPTWTTGTAPLEAEQPAAPMFPRLKLREIFSRPNLEDLVEDFLRERTTSIFGAEYGAFKSFVLLDIGMSVATGRNWQGRKVKQGRVVYIVAEGAYETKARAQAWLQFHGINEVPEDFDIIEIPVQIVQFYRQLIEELREFAPALVIVNTVAQCNIGRDENDTGATGEFTHAIRTISRELEAHVACAHHNGNCVR